MFDRILQTHLKTPLARIAGRMAVFGITANQVTLTGFLLGVIGCLALALHQPVVALVLLALNRFADGLDGALARHTGPTDLGGYLDIVLDFLIYSGVIFAHAIAYPADALWAAFLIFSFIGTGSSFLAFAIIEAKRDTTVSQDKSFAYLGGLTEGFETIVALGLIIILPSYFAIIAGVFGLMCWLTTIMRLRHAVRVFGAG